MGVIFTCVPPSISETVAGTALSSLYFLSCIFVELIILCFIGSENVSDGTTVVATPGAPLAGVWLTIVGAAVSLIVVKYETPSELT